MTAGPENSSSLELEPAVRELLSDGAPIGKLATKRKNGHPWIQALWFALDDDEIVIVLTRDAITTRCLRRTGRGAFLVDDDRLPYRFVVLECTAEVDDSESKARSSLRTLITRYRPDIDIDAEIEMYIEMGVVTATLRAERVFYMPQVVDLEKD
jgi:hypothetical protein